MNSGNTINQRVSTQYETCGSACCDSSYCEECSRNVARNGDSSLAGNTDYDFESDVYADHRHNHNQNAASSGLVEDNDPTVPQQSQSALNRFSDSDADSSSSTDRDNRRAVRVSKQQQKRNKFQASSRAGNGNGTRMAVSASPHNAFNAHLNGTLANMLPPPPIDPPPPPPPQRDCFNDRKPLATQSGPYASTPITPAAHAAYAQSVLAQTQSQMQLQLQLQSQSPPASKNLSATGANVNVNVNAGAATATATISNKALTNAVGNTGTNALMINGTLSRRAVMGAGATPASVTTSNVNPAFATSPSHTYDYYLSANDAAILSATSNSSPPSSTTAANANANANLRSTDILSAAYNDGNEYMPVGNYETLIGQSMQFNTATATATATGTPHSQAQLRFTSVLKSAELDYEASAIGRSPGKLDVDVDSAAFMRPLLPGRYHGDRMDDAKSAFLSAAYTPNKIAKRISERKWKFAALFMSFALVVLIMLTTGLFLLQTFKNVFGSAGNAQDGDGNLVATGGFMSAKSWWVQVEPQLAVGERRTLHLPPFQLVYVLLDVPLVNGHSDVLYSVSIGTESGAGSELVRRLGLFLRFNHRPSPVDYDFSELFHFEPKAGRTQTAVKSLRTGRWFLGLYSDEVNTTASVSLLVDSVSQKAVSDASDNDNCTGFSNSNSVCNDNGWCVAGRCVCFADYDGPLCESRRCPIVCNNRGVLRSGRCECFAEYTGVECEIERRNRCAGVDCGAHGTCVQGSCQCEPPYSGAFCDVLKCDPHDCNTNGQCVNGACRCFHGWAGAACDRPVNSHVSSAAAAACAASCVNGRCVDNECVCHAFWTGSRCHLPTCHPRCVPPHGTCQNGTCHCSSDYYGPFCQYRQCEDCAAAATCIQRPAKPPSCRCQNSSLTLDCKFLTEQRCSDRIDNDNDGLVDCDDPNCCDKPECKSASNCRLPPDAETAVLSIPVSVRSGFYDKVRFLFDGEDAPQRSLTSNNLIDTLDRRLIAVVTGHIWYQSVEILNCIVSVVGQPQFGYTLTARSGKFDLAMNGGRSFTLNVSCRGKLEHYVDLYVPTNRFVVLLPSELSTRDLRQPAVSVSTAARLGLSSSFALRSVTALNGSTAQLRCERNVQHDPTKLQPRVYTYWLQAPPATMRGRATLDLNAANIRTGCSQPAQNDAHSLSVSKLLLDRAALLESVRVANSSVNLVWSNLGTSTYPLMVYVVMTPPTWPEMPPGLQNVYLHLNFDGRAAIDPTTTYKGKLRRFDAMPNVTFQFVYSRDNLYSQSISGLVTAFVYVGYEYIGCPGKIFWERLSFQLAAAVSTPVSIGGWSLDVIHSYDFKNNVLHKGDLSTHYFDLSSYTVDSLVGQPQQRRSLTESSDGLLYNPLALITDSYGNVIIGDHNQIRYVNTTLDEKNRVSSVVTSLISELPPYSYLAAAPERYHFAFNPRVPGYLFVSDALQRRIWRVRLNPHAEEAGGVQLEPFLGTGEQCAAGEIGCSACSSINDCALIHPRSIAFDAEGNGYFIDGNSLKLLTPLSVSTLIDGGQSMVERRRRFAGVCLGDSVPFSDLLLRSPIVQYSVFDDHLYLADQDVLYRLSLQSRIAYVITSSVSCNSTGAGYLFRNIRDVTIHSDGDVYLLDGANIVRLRTDRRVEVLYDESSNAFGDARFDNVRAIAIGTDRLFVADKTRQGAVVWMAYHTGISAVQTADDGKDLFLVKDPASSETYFFDADGRHIRTAFSSGTGELVTRYEFVYSAYAIPGVNQFDADGQITWQLAIAKADNLRDFVIRATSLRDQERVAESLLTLRITEVGDTRYSVVVEVIAGQNSVRYEYVTLNPSAEPVLSGKHYPLTNQTFRYFYTAHRGLLSKINYPNGASLELGGGDVKLVDDWLVYNVTLPPNANSLPFVSFGALLGGSTTRTNDYLWPVGQLPSTPLCVSVQVTQSRLAAVSLGYNDAQSQSRQLTVSENAVQLRINPDAVWNVQLSPRRLGKREARIAFSDSAADRSNPLQIVAREEQLDDFVERSLQIDAVEVLTMRVQRSRFANANGNETILISRSNRTLMTIDRSGNSSIYSFADTNSVSNGLRTVLVRKGDAVVDSDSSSGSDRNRDGSYYIEYTSSSIPVIGSRVPYPYPSPVEPGLSQSPCLESGDIAIRRSFDSRTGLLRNASLHDSNRSFSSQLSVERSSVLSTKVSKLTVSRAYFDRVDNFKLTVLAKTPSLSPSRIVELHDALALAQEYELNPDGKVASFNRNLLKFSYSDRQYNVTCSSEVTLSLTYDDLGRPVAMAATNLLQSRNLARVKFDYDAENRFVAVWSNDGALNVSVRLDYDKSGKLQSVDQAAVKFDGRSRLVQLGGNRIEYDESTAQARLSDAIGTRRTYRFDPAGSMVQVTSEAVTNFEYDSLGRAVKIEVVTENRSSTGLYWYDEENRLVRRRVEQQDDSFFYDENGRLVLLVAADASAIEFVYDQSSSCLLLMRNHSRVRGSVEDYLVLSDPFCSPLLLINRGEVIASFAYSAFGARQTTLYRGNLLNSVQMIGFQGGIEDAFAGLLFIGNAWYDPNIGRFLQPGKLSGRGLFGRLRFDGTQVTNPFVLREPFVYWYLNSQIFAELSKVLNVYVPPALVNRVASEFPLMRLLELADSSSSSNSARVEDIIGLFEEVTR